MPQQTLQQFGASIKAKHPEYKDMDDEAVGKGVLAKYPQYSDMVQATPVSTDPSGRTPTGEPAQRDTRNGFQRTLDNLITPDPRREEWQSPTRNAVDDFARHAANTVVPLISHPLQSAGNMIHSAGDAMAHNPGNAEGALSDLLVKPLVEQYETESAQHGPGRAVSNLIGTGLGTAATGELAGEAAAPVLRGGARIAGPVAEKLGLKLGNTALGATGPKPFKYGANPARGVFEENGPFLTRGGAAGGVDEALPKVGQRVSDKVLNSGGTVPLSDVAQSIEGPVNEARGIIEGPGGGNRSFEPVQALQDSMGRQAPGASSPIYGPQVSPSQFFPDATAPDLWRTIQNLDKNTRFNPDPEVEGVNELRRDIRGGLRGNLEDAVPGLKPETQRYSDLKSAEDVLGRSMHGGMSAGKLLSIPATPIESTLGYGLYTGGKALNRIGGTSGYVPLIPPPQEQR